MRARIGRITLGTALALVIAGGLTFGAREALAYQGAEPCQHLCGLPDGANLCNQCCIESGLYDGGLCTVNGTCLCYNN